jgi:8-oxo-dGTP diphosphatase
MSRMPARSSVEGPAGPSRACQTSHLAYSAPCYVSVVPERVWVSLTGRGLALVASAGSFCFPSRPGVATARLPFPDAVHARIFPVGTAQRVLSDWSHGGLDDGWMPVEHPRWDRRRGGAVVLSGGRTLLIRYPPSAGRRYFIPGGGVEAGETPAQAAVRELREETGLAGTVVRELATVYNRGREEHYYLLDAAGPARPRDLASGETLEWVDVPALPDTPVWPKRLAWRISWWSAHGWPDRPAVLADSSGDLDSPCDW